ncbi:MAG: DNA-binding transcriptional regulator [Kiritimatiellae bacterium]|nr:DNA-binding transcriptional regulator [Kiritimatiellia bacterium]
MDTSRGYEQGLIRGILKYSRLHGPWKFFRIIPVVSGGRKIVLADLKNWNADGIIMREKDEFIPALSLGLPAIIAPYRNTFHKHSNITTNDNAVGIMAAEHFLDRGFRHFAYYGVGNWSWSFNRQNSFSRRLAKDGFKTHIYTDLRQSSQAEKQSRLANWLSSLPRPFGLMVCTDDRSHDCFEACKIAGLDIPEDIAIIGVGNDELVCDFSDPPLSSIVLNTEQGGYKAAELLAGMISRKKAGNRNIIVEPLHVVTRQSTDILATEDRNIARAICFIRDNAGHNINVEDVVKSVPMSRRLLYHRFKKVLGRSIHEEIIRAQVQYAAKMLSETDLPITEIAFKLGYPDAKNLSRIFRREKGITPTAYRKNTASGGINYSSK